MNTKTKPNQKKFIKSGQIHQNPTISQLRSQCYRCRLGATRWSRTRDLGSGFTGKVEGCDFWVRFEVEVERRSRRVQSQRALGLPVKSKVAIWVRFEVEVERQKSKGAIRSRSRRLWALGSISLWVRSLWPELGWPEGCALSLSLSLSLCLCFPKSI